ncbi:MAG: hypothetical protein PHW91_09800 [Bacteroidales bacterium]|nr:hypothetical protein [Bacteroidales bacterium]
MDINRDNYEFFLIDYIDGNLTAKQLEAVENFLWLNPDLKNELEGLSKHILKPDSQTYKDKFTLKRTDYSVVGLENEFDYLCIANLENDIDDEEGIKLNVIVNSNKNKAKDYSDYLNTKLLPNKEISYQQKSKLKRFTLFGYTRKQIIYFSSAAALLLLLVTLFDYNTNSSATKQNKIIVQDIAIPSVESVSILNNDTEKGKRPNSSDPKRVQNIEVASTPMEHKEELATQIIATIEPERKSEEFNLAYLKPKTARIIKVENDLYSPARLLYANMLSYEPLVVINPQQQGTSKTFGLFELAQLGINRLAKVTGRTINLEGVRDETGKIKRIEFTSELFALSAPAKHRK